MTLKWLGFFECGPSNIIKLPRELYTVDGHIIEATQKELIFGFRFKCNNYLRYVSIYLLYFV